MLLAQLKAGSTKGLMPSVKSDVIRRLWRKIEKKVIFKFIFYSRKKFQNKVVEIILNFNSDLVSQGDSLPVRLANFSWQPLSSAFQRGGSVDSWQVNEHGRVLIKLYLHQHVAAWLWPEGRGVLPPALRLHPYLTCVLQVGLLVSCTPCFCVQKSRENSGPRPSSWMGRFKVTLKVSHVFFSG